MATLKVECETIPLLTLESSNRSDEGSSSISGCDFRRLLEVLQDDTCDANEEINNNLLLHKVASLEKKDYSNIKTYFIARLKPGTFFTTENNKTALHISVENENIEFCEVLIDALKEISKKTDKINESLTDQRNKNDVDEQMKIFINQTCEENLTAVHLASKSSYPEILDLLLKNGGDPLALTCDQETPLHFAVLSGSEKCVKLLLNEVSSRTEGSHDNKLVQYLNMQTADGMTALMFAAKQGFLILCHKLMKTDLNLESNQGKTALHYAATKGIQVVNFFFKNMYGESEGKKRILLHDVNLLKTYLHSSIEGGSSKCFAHFLEKAPDTKLTSEQVKDLVDFSVNSRSLKCLKQMIERPEFHEYLLEFRDSDDNSLLHLTIEAQKFSAARKLLEEVLLDKLVRNKDGDSALHVLARESGELLRDQEHREYVVDELLWNAQELVKSTNKKGMTPLHVAASFNNTNLIKRLLNRNLDAKSCILQQTKENKTAVHYAVEKGNDECLEMLLDKIPTEDLVPEENVTHPLHLAASKGHMKCCELLLAHNPVKRHGKEGLFSMYSSGKYPVDKAYDHRNIDIFRFLLSKMQHNASQEVVNDEFSVRLHGYFKECLDGSSKRTGKPAPLQDEEKSNFNEAILEAIIDSSWCEVVLNGRFCRAVRKQVETHGYKQDELRKDAVPCNSLALLIRNFPHLACQALDRHIRSDGTYVYHNFIPFENIYYRIEGNRLESPFYDELSHEELEEHNPKMRSPRGHNDGSDVLSRTPTPESQTTTSPKIKKQRNSNTRVRPDSKEFPVESWFKDHPLNEALKCWSTEVLNHKLTKSWVMRNGYTRQLFMCSAFSDLFTAFLVLSLQDFFWNTYQLQETFSGATREQISEVYSSDFQHNSSLQAMASDVRVISESDPDCATWGTNNSSDHESVEEGTAAWNRSFCAIFHLEKKSSFVIGLEVVVAVLILLHVVAEVFLTRGFPSRWEIHRVSRTIRICAMTVFLVGLNACDFVLGTRQSFVWQMGVMAALMAYMHLVITVNENPDYGGFLPVTPKLGELYCTTIAPFCIILLGFTLAFLFLFDNLSFSTAHSSIVKTLTMAFGELDYDSTFSNDETPVRFPILASIIFVMYIIIVGGVLWRLVNRSENTFLKELNENDETRRAATFLQMHLLIEKLIPCLRRKQARSYVRLTVQQKRHFSKNKKEN